MREVTAIETVSNFVGHRCNIFVPLLVVAVAVALLAAVVSSRSASVGSSPGPDVINATALAAGDSTDAVDGKTSDNGGSCRKRAYTAASTRPGCVDFTTPHNYTVLPCRRPQGVAACPRPPARPLIVRPRANVPPRSYHT